MKVSRSERPRAECLDASSAAWSDAKTETVLLAAIPLDQQPTRYIRAAWSDRPYGTVTSVTASACAAGDDLFVRLEWPDDVAVGGEDVAVGGEDVAVVGEDVAAGAEDVAASAEFADAAAVVTGAGPIETLGSDSAETGLWYWAADRESPERFASRGPGVFSRSDASGLEAAGALNDGVWRVVLSGPLTDVVDDRIGIAVWNGSNEERAGLGAVSGWIPLDKE